MGIDNIHILTDPDSSDQDLQVRRKENRVSQHTVMAVKLKESDNGLHIDPAMRVKLYGEKDDGV